MSGGGGSGRVGPATRLLGLLGGPGVRRSRSPAIQNAALSALGIDARYACFDVAVGAVGDAVRGARALGFLGLNVTMPHKEEAFAQADVWDDATAAIGACNTLRFAEGRTIARNTDAPAIADVLGADLPGSDAVVLGAGGSARAATYALRSGGARRVRVLARDLGKADFAALLGAEAAPLSPEGLEGASIVVSCVPPGAALDLAGAARGARFVDLVYQEESALLRAARAAGMRAEDGLEVLVRQAWHALRIWLEVAPPIDVMRAAARGGST